MSEPLSPVDYPTLNIGGTDYILRHGTGSQLRMERMGYTPEKMQEMFIWSEVDGVRKAVGMKMPMEMSFAWLATCAGNFRKGKWIPCGLSPEEIADQFTMDQFGMISEAIGKMFAKAQPAQSNPATAPASQPEIETNTGQTSGDFPVHIGDSI